MQSVTITQITPPELEALIEGALRKILSHHIPPADFTQDRILTIQEAGDLIHLTTPTIYGLVHTGSIPHSKKGKRLYFNQKELLDWIKSGKRKTRVEIEAEADDFLSTNERKGKKKTTTA